MKMSNENNTDTYYDPQNDPYDDILPVCLHGELLLDRHNDLLATFYHGIEQEDRERIVNLINAPSPLGDKSKDAPC